MALDPSRIPNLIADFGLTPMLAGYSAEPTVRDRVFAVKPIDPNGSEFGWRETVVVGDNIPKETLVGENAPERIATEGYVAYGKQRKLSQRMVIPEEIWKSPSAEGTIKSMIMDRFGAWAQGFQVAKERAAASVFLRGCIAAGDTAVFNGSYGGPSGAVDPNIGFILDGKPFFAASGNGHPLFLSSAATPFNLITSAPLSATTLETARVAITSTNAVDDMNNPIVVTPDTLLVPPGLQQTAEVLVGSIQQPGTAQNDINTARGRYNVVVWRYLTDVDGWFIGKAGQGAVFCDSGDPTIETSLPDPANGNITVRMISYYGHYVRDWRYWFANNIASS